MSPRHGEKQSYKNCVVVKADILGYCNSFPSGSASPSVFLAVRSAFHEQKQLDPCYTRLFASFVLKTISGWFMAVSYMLKFTCSPRSPSLQSGLMKEKTLVKSIIISGNIQDSWPAWFKLVYMRTVVKNMSSWRSLLLMLPFSFVKVIAESVRLSLVSARVLVVFWFLTAFFMVILCMTYVTVPVLFSLNFLLVIDSNVVIWFLLCFFFKESFISLEYCWTGGFYALLAHEKDNTLILSVAKYVYFLAV